MSSLGLPPAHQLRHGRSGNCVLGRIEHIRCCSDSPTPYSGLYRLKTALQMTFIAGLFNLLLVLLQKRAQAGFLVNSTLHRSMQNMLLLLQKNIYTVLLSKGNWCNFAMKEYIRKNMTEDQIQSYTQLPGPSTAFRSVYKSCVPDIVRPKARSELVQRTVPNI